MGLSLSQGITISSNQQAPSSKRNAVSKDNVESNQGRYSMSTSGLHTQVHKHILTTTTTPHSHTCTTYAQTQQNINYVN